MLLVGSAEAVPVLTALCEELGTTVAEKVAIEEAVFFASVAVAAALVDGTAEFVKVSVTEPEEVDQEVAVAQGEGVALTVTVTEPVRVPAADPVDDTVAVSEMLCVTETVADPVAPPAIREPVGAVLEDAELVSEGEGEAVAFAVGEVGPG